MTYERFHGVRQIVWFNWPFYATAVSIVLAAPLVAWRAPLLPPSLVYWVIAPIAWWLAASLVASWLVYDRSSLMRGDWIPEMLSTPPREWIAIHAGFDEMSPMLRARFGGSHGRAFDIFNPADMTEGSIARAQRAAGAVDGAEHADWRHLPVPSSSLGAVFLLLSAHELRIPAARAALFEEIARVLVPSGTVVLAEHLRDGPNFLAFGPGFLHFHSRRTWTRSFAAAGFVVRSEIHITPFVRVFRLGRSA